MTRKLRLVLRADYFLRKFPCGSRLGSERKRQKRLVGDIRQASSFLGTRTDEVAVHEKLGGLLWGQCHRVAQLLKPTDMVSLNACCIELVKVIGAQIRYRASCHARHGRE